MNISEKNKTKAMSMVLLSGHQIVLIDKVFHLLLWQQWRFKMAENENLIQSISETILVIPIYFLFKHFFSNKYFFWS